MGFAASSARLLRGGWLPTLTPAADLTKRPDRTLIFLNYRRADTADTAEILADRLTARFGAGTVFLDRRSIEFGDYFTATIDAALRRARVLLALIGPRWLSVADPAGRRRLDDPRDLVRSEIERGLEYGLTIVPVLIGATTRPSADQLPPTLVALAHQPTAVVGQVPHPEEINQLAARIDTAFTERDDGQADVGPASQID